MDEAQEVTTLRVLRRYDILRIIKVLVELEDGIGER